MGKNIYIGNRYVPKIMGTWDSSIEYEGLSIVQWEGNSFTSKKMVPSNVLLSNEEYWASTGNYNAQLENYRREVKLVDEKVDTLKVDTAQNLADSENRTNTKITELETNTTKNLEDSENRTNEKITTLETDTTKNLGDLKELTDKNLTDFKNEANAIFKETENNIPVTAYMSNAELEDIKLEQPLLDHSLSIQNYVNDMILKKINILYFPSGHYRFKNIDLKENPFVIKGFNTGSGYIHSTFFNIISEMNGKGFFGSTRYLTLIDFSAKSEGTKIDNKNTTFYDNFITDGAFITTKNVQFSNFSGDVIKAFDVIDSNFSDIRLLSNKNVFNFKPNKWVRSTTITFNKVYGELNDQVFDVPFCSQSKIIDCIFEHGGEVGNINDGSWTIDNLYLENNTGDLNATNSLLTKFYIYSLNGGKILNTQPDVPPIDRGTSQVNWKGINASRVEYDTLVPKTIFTGNYIDNSWVKLGRWESLKKGGRLQIKLLGGNDWGQTTTGINTPVGETTIDLMHAINTAPELANTVGFAYHVGGGKPLLEVKVKAVEPEWRDKFDVYIKITSNARYVSADYKVVEGFFTPDLTLDVSYPGDNDKNVHGVKMEYHIQTDTGAFSVKTTGQLDLIAPVLDGGTLNQSVKNYLPITVNGTEYQIPLL